MKFRIFIFLIFLALPVILSAQEEITITTYYPSPYGSYNDLYVKHQIVVGNVDNDSIQDERDMLRDAATGSSIEGGVSVRGALHIGRINWQGPVDMYYPLAVYNSDETRDAIMQLEGVATDDYNFSGMMLSSTRYLGRSPRNWSIEHRSYDPFNPGNANVGVNGKENHDFLIEHYVDDTGVSIPALRISEANSPGQAHVFIPGHLNLGVDLDDDSNVSLYAWDGDGAAEATLQGVGNGVNYAALSLANPGPTVRMWQAAMGQAASVLNKLVFRYTPDFDGGAWTNHMVVDASGNVGIGTNSPSVKLDVQGSMNFTGQKICIVLPAGGSGGAPAPLLVPASWTKTTCSNFATTQLGGSGYRVGCIFTTSSSVGTGTNNPSPNCGW
ncbi:MAG: hypothetical protein AB1481_02780 [Candidatus Omnitrophota bacterium]